MRVALLPSAYAPSVGGVEVLTHRLAVNLQRAGHVVEVWTGRSAGDALPREEVLDGVTVRRFVFTAPRAALGAVIRWPSEALATYRELLSAVEALRPDVLHVQCFSGNGAYATAVSRRTGVPLVVSLQGETVMDDNDIYDRSAYLRLALRLGLRRASRVTGCSAFTIADAVNRFALDATKAEVVFNGVDQDEVVPEQFEVPFERYVLGLGRFVHKKGFDLLVAAFAQVAGTDRGLGLVLVGSGAAEAATRDLVDRLHLADRVHFAGALGRGQVAAVMAGAEVFVMPSRVEPFGIVALEAWRAGTPAIVSSRGGAAEFVEDGVSGLVVDATDVTSLGDSIRRVSRSPELRARLAAGGSARVGEFAWSRISDLYLRIYQQVRSQSQR
jgi:glycosyltransferase involved in cell wall biosynthesis